MSNITTTTKTFYDFIEMTHEIDRVLGYSQRGCGKHFHPGTGEFHDWHKTKGYGNIDPDGKDTGSSQIWYAEYRKDVADGKWAETPYMDFWHWQMDNCVNDNFRNDSYSTVYVGMDGYKFDEAEPWQLEIQKVWYETFKDIADEDGHIDIWVSW